jgi:hypothetical protein
MQKLSEYLKLAMAVAGRFSAHSLSPLQLRVPIQKVRDKARLALRFGTNLEQTLAHSCFERQFGGNMICEGNATFGFKARRIFSIQ